MGQEKSRWKHNGFAWPLLTGRGVTSGIHMLPVKTWRLVKLAFFCQGQESTCAQEGSAIVLIYHAFLVWECIYFNFSRGAVPAPLGGLQRPPKKKKKLPADLGCTSWRLRSWLGWALGKSQGSYHPSQVLEKIPTSLWPTNMLHG